ncbi:MAG: hypothetical protein ABIU05_11215 [Nitrospirales bacterium]
MTKQIKIDDFSSLCTAIGFVVVNWALAEQSLDFTVETIYAKCAGNTIEKQFPRSFQRKVKFLRKAFSKRVALQVYAAERNKLLDRMEPLAQQRHDWVHGVIVSIESVNGRFPIDKLAYGEKENIMRRIEFDPKTYDIFVQELLNLGKDLTHFGTKIVQRFSSL